MVHIMKSKVITVSIHAAPAAVYAFASNPANLPQWIPIQGVNTGVFIEIYHSRQ